MTERYDTYGWAGEDLDDLTARIARSLHLTFEPHWSDEWGGAYWATERTPQGRIKLVRNFEDEDGVLLEDTRPELTVVLDSTGLTQDQCAVLESLGGQLLNSSII